MAGREVRLAGGHDRLPEVDNDLIGSPEEPGLIGEDEYYREHQFSSSSSGFRVHSPRHWQSICGVDSDEGGVQRKACGFQVKQKASSPYIIWPSEQIKREPVSVESQAPNPSGSRRTVSSDLASTASKLSFPILGNMSHKFSRGHTRSSSSGAAQGSCRAAATGTAGCSYVHKGFPFGTKYGRRGSGMLDLACAFYQSAHQERLTIDEGARRHIF